MRTRLILSLVFFVPALVGCGKFADKFSRINGDVTRVYFSSRNDELHGAAVLNGGLMIYFKENTNDSGKVFGFSNEDLVNSKSVLLPNGVYKVYAFGWSGSNPLEGQVRCGYGDGGSDLTLSGASRTVNITLNQSNCAFGSAGPFGVANGGNAASATNFKVLKTQFCTGAAYPSCTAASADGYYLKAELLAGYGANGANSFVEAPDFNITSACSTSSSTSSFLLSSFVIPMSPSGYISPPVRLRFYSDSTCSTLAGTYQFNDGFEKFLSVSSGASYFVDMISASSSYYLLQLNKYF